MALPLLKSYVPSPTVSHVLAPSSSRSTLCQLDMDPLFYSSMLLTTSWTLVMCSSCCCVMRVFTMFQSLTPSSDLPNFFRLHSQGHRLKCLGPHPKLILLRICNAASAIARMMCESYEWMSLQVYCRKALSAGGFLNVLFVLSSKASLCDGRHWVAAQTNSILQSYVPCKEMTSATNPSGKSRP